VEGSYWYRLVRPAYAGRKFVLAVDVLAGVGRTLEHLRRLGARRPFVIAAARGIGDVPGPDDAEIAMIDVEGGSTMTWLRNVERTMQSLPADVVARLDAWDPLRQARVLGPFLFTEARVAGRPMYGARPDRLMRLEDKMIVDGLWDRALVRRAPSRILPVGDAALAAAAAAELDWGAGTVWVADNTYGWHGGAEMLRWVAHPGLASDAHRYLAARARKIRIMPFLEGVPCSIHGIVAGERVIAVRPVEMLTLRHPEVGVLQYVGTATFYDPPAGLRIEMRRIAVDVGLRLREEFGYTGAFTIDGVATGRGFLPTELNPRLGAGLLRAVRDLEDVWLVAIQRALLAGEPYDYRPADLEELLVDAADSGRNGGAFLMIDEAPDRPRLLHLRFEGATPAVVDEADADTTVEWGFGTGAGGGGLGVRFDADRTPHGPSVAPRVAAAVASAAAHFGLEVPVFEAAADLHRT
jgi:hypothetical protein